MAPNKSSSGFGLSRLLTWLAVLVGVLSPIVYVLEQNLDSFYVFQPDELHSLAKRAVAQHGKNTRAIVEHIVLELQQTHSPYVTTTEDWFFNNAGGAMGALYIIHASEKLLAIDPLQDIGVPELTRFHLQA